MKIVVDTNIVFSAVLNSNARIAQILLSPKKRARFYSTNQLLSELQKHQTKLKNIAGYGDEDIARIISIVTKHIQFIDVRLISEKSYATALVLTRDVDIDDTEFVALTEHLKGKLWTGDKVLLNHLAKRGWNRAINTAQLLAILK